MNYRFRRFFLAVFLCSASLYTSFGQITEQGAPILLEHPEWLGTIVQKMPQKKLAALDIKQLETEDAQEENTIRFAAPILTDINLDNSGTWTTLPDGGRVWHCALKSPNAIGLVVYFDKFKLANGAELFAFSPDQKQIEGKFTHRSNTKHEVFTIGLIYGDEVILELYEPASAIGKTLFSIDRVDYAYNEDLVFTQSSDADMFGFGQSSNCQVNANCQVGSNWELQKKGIARIMMKLAQGTGWCSGSLIANTAMSRDEYFLSAFHCIDGYTADYFHWKFYFDYEAPACPNPVLEPDTYNTIIGCELRSGWRETDFLLLELNTIPDYYDVYYNGWNRSPGSLPSSTMMLHHPAGDIMKISVDNDSAIVYPFTIQWSNNFYSGVWTHYNIGFDQGYFQPGSSGAPLFDTQGRIIAQLHGGDYIPTDPCNVGNSYFGRFSLSWENPNVDSANHLSPFLDPLNTDVYAQDGYAPFDPSVDIGGKVRSSIGVPMQSVMVKLSGDDSAVTFTDQSGDYLFSELEPGNYTVECEKTGLEQNGVNTFDLLKMRKFILGLEDMSTWELIAGDVTNDNAFNTFDLNETNKLSLGLITTFSNSPSWRFYDADHQFSDPSYPFGDMPTQKVLFQNLDEDRINTNFIGIKIGDVNGDADPNM